jgi:hypothetical protein
MNSMKKLQKEGHYQTSRTIQYLPILPKRRLTSLRAWAHQGTWQLQRNRNFRENRRFQAGNWFPD